MSDHAPTRVLDTPVVIGSAPVDEVQKLVVTAEGGTFTLTVASKATTAIAWNATAAEVQTALEALSTVAPGDILVTGGPGDSTGSKPFILNFAGNFADENAPAITASAASLTGGTHTAVISTVTEGVGNANAVIRGSGNADATERVSPLAGESPTARREAHGSEFE